MSRHDVTGPGSKIRGAIRELVFGLEDSLVSTTGAVAGIAAGTGDARIVVLSGAVLIAVEAISMAAGSYLSNKSHREVIERKIREEREEIEREPERERQELIMMYRERGFSEDEVAILVKRITADKGLWLEEMMAKELKIGAADLDEPKSGALVMGVSYVAGGLVPLAPFLLMPLGLAIPVSIGAAGAALFGVGAWKSKATGLSPWKSGLEMLLVAASAAVLGYLIGRGLGMFFGLTAP